jgi:flagellar hook assembly protein FlgD
MIKIAHDLNRTFGPILVNKNACLDKIQDYEFYVFNRWNQKVFESNNIKDEWDGNKDDGTKYQSETYMFVTRYNVVGKEIVIKGSIYMIR